MSDLDPKVSVIIPTRNRRALLAQTVRSVLLQSYGNWEAIVVDDHSTDGTDEMMSQMCAVDSRLLFISRASAISGANICRNEGFAASRGDYVIFLDSDDFLADFCLRDRVRAMQRYPELDFGIFACEAFHETPGDARVLFSADTGEDDLDKMLRLDIAWQTTSPMWKRQTLRQLGSWDEDAPSWQDWIFHIRAIVRGLKYKRFPRPDCYWRMARPEKESISARASRSAEHLVNRTVHLIRIEEMIARAGLLTPRRRVLLAGTYFHHAEHCARLDPRLATQVWHACWRRQLITARQYTMGMSFFRFFNWGRANRWHRAYFARFWSRELLGTTSRVHLKACYNPLPGEERFEAEPHTSPGYDSTRAAG